MRVASLVTSFVAAAQLASAAPNATDVGACLSDARVEWVSNNASTWGNVDRTLFNQRLQYKPLLIALPTTLAHVQAAVSCGARLGARVAGKCGGHGYASTAFGGEDGQLVIDLNRMNKTTVGARNVAKVQAGARLGMVATELFAQGQRAIAHGTCPGVGVAGHVLGGGYGMASHTHGLALDWLVGATVVLANGSAVHASTTDNPDLFWAIRGGGSAFGVVTEFEFDTFAAPANVTYYTVSTSWNENQTVAGLKAVQEYAAKDMPAELNMRIALDGGSRRMEGVFYGSAAQLNQTLWPLLNRTSARLSLNKTVGWMDALRYYAYGTEMVPSRPYSQHETFYSSSMTTNALTDDQLKSFVNYLFKGIQTNGRNWWIQIDLHGGPTSAVAQVASDATAYAHRDKLLLYQLYDRAFFGSYPSNGFGALQGIIANATKGMSASDWGMYINYPDTQMDAQTAQQRYWGKNLARLQRIKKQFDPKEVFWNPQSVRPAA